MLPSPLSQTAGSPQELLRSESLSPGVALKDVSEQKATGRHVASKPKTAKGLFPGLLKTEIAHQNNQSILIIGISQSHFKCNVLEINTKTGCVQVFSLTIFIFSLINRLTNMSPISQSASAYLKIIFFHQALNFQYIN